MNSAVIFDCEFLCLEDSQRRFWCGAQDPDPVVAQIGATRIALSGSFEIVDTFRTYVKPVDRHGQQYGLTPFFTEFTGITEAAIASDGMAIADALAAFERFAGGAKCWSWGKDEFNMVAISCYVAGVPFPIPATRFDNAVKLLLAGGMPPEDLAKTRSSKLADYYGIEHPPFRSHDALDDALSVSYAVQHLLRAGNLTLNAFA